MPRLPGMGPSSLLGGEPAGFISAGKLRPLNNLSWIVYSRSGWRAAAGPRHLSFYVAKVVDNWQDLEANCFDVFSGGPPAAPFFVKTKLSGEANLGAQISLGVHAGGTLTTPCGPLALSIGPCHESTSRTSTNGLAIAGSTPVGYFSSSRVGV